MSIRNEKGQFNPTHNLSCHRIYNIWNLMRDRCLNEDASNYKNYGGRGINVCDRWFESFENFFKDMGMPPSDIHQLDRKDNDKDYEPYNCRWVTPKENMNNRRSCHILTHREKTQSITLWAEELNISRDVLYMRINQYEWSVEEALSIPLNGRR